MTLKKVLAAVAGVALVGVAGPAWAAAPYDITVGSSTSGTFALAGDAAGGIDFAVQGPDDVQLLGCEIATASGTITAELGSDGLGVGTITDTTWEDCIGPGGLSMQVTHVGNWSINIDGDASGTQVDGYIGDVQAQVSDIDASGMLCNFTVTGEAHGYFDTVTQQLVVEEVGFSGNLELSGVTGCFGLVTNGNPADFEGAYDIDSPGGLIDIN